MDLLRPVYNVISTVHNLFDTELWIQRKIVVNTSVTMIEHLIYALTGFILAS